MWHPHTPYFGTLLHWIPLTHSFATVLRFLIFCRCGDLPASICSRSIFCIGLNYYIPQEKEQIRKRAIQQGVCSVITTLRSTHIRNHSLSTKRLKSGGRAFDIYRYRHCQTHIGGMPTEQHIRGEMVRKQ